MDVDSLIELLAAIERNEKNTIARDLLEPSPLAAEILYARPYAFLDDAPLEERRTRAVFQRRWLDPEKAADMASLISRLLTACAGRFGRAKKSG